jgi:predicted nucleotidyltransferase
MQPVDLLPLATMLSRWADGIPVIGKVILFGSRVRGDHRPDSDVDVRVEFDYSNPQVSIAEWMAENDSDFADLKSLLPGALQLHQEQYDAALPHIRTGQVILQLGKVSCVLTPSRRQTSATSRP